MATTIRMALRQWQLSLIKIFALTSAILSFLLIWLFYNDYNNTCHGHHGINVSCTVELILLLGAVIGTSIFVYSLVIKSHVELRITEFFLRKLYGAPRIEILMVMALDTLLFLLISYLLSLILIDQLAPLLNNMTNRQIQMAGHQSYLRFTFVAFLWYVTTFLAGTLPLLSCAGRRAADFFEKIDIKNSTC